jgi:hypothetical protein
LTRKTGEAMSIKLFPGFQVSLRLSDVASPDPGRASLSRLRSIVAGKDASFSRRAAMALLLHSDFPNRDEDFARVLENDDELPRFRYLAAVNLGRTHTPFALSTLIHNLRIQDARVRAGVLAALGCMGDMAALQAISRLQDKSPQALFASTLIAHRLGLDGYDWPAPSQGDLLEPIPGAARPAHWRRADETEVEFALRSLSVEPFGIAYAQTPAYQLRCDKRNLMILVNRDFARESIVRELSQRKALYGAVALRNDTNRLYSISLLILTSPVAQGFQICLVNTRGTIAYSGGATVRGDVTEFSIRAVRRPGASAFRMHGSIRDGTAHVAQVLSSILVQRRLEPQESIEPPSLPRERANSNVTSPSS